MAQVDILSPKQAADLFYVAQWAAKNGCLIPLPAELAELINISESEAAVIIAASATCREWSRPWVTKEEIVNTAHQHYQEAGEWKIEDLLAAAVRMEYLVSHGNGTYECTSKVAAHLAYLKFLLRPPRPSPARRHR